ncbi:hypothetical protein BGZ88_005923, partial [Linnemannia elongata]
MADGSRKPGCIVEYRYQHNHSIGDITDLGTRQKSAAIKATIERLINQGSTIQRVMQQLTMDYDKFTQITRGNGQQLSRDDFITYDDTSDAFILSNWLLAICRKMKDLFSTDNEEYNFLPNAIITDQGGSEILAMKTVFPGVPILYCAWHVLRVWERQVKTRMTGLGVHTVKEREGIRAQLRSDLRKILYERNKAMAQKLIKAFRETWSGQKELLEYLDKNYFGRSMFEAHEWQVKDIQKTWMLCYRQDISYASIDTNNYIESWHNTLKRHFFRDKQQRRPDTVIYVLAVLAVPHFQQKCIRSIVN